MSERAVPSEQRVRAAYALASPCRICPRLCRVDRTQSKSGYCGVGDVPVLASSGPHYGEEACLVGSGGSGTIFLSGCNLLCVFCQNCDISHGVQGLPGPPARLAELMLGLERDGCENVNFVTPSHVVPWLMDAVRRARLRGLSVPLVYNSGGYELVDTLKLLEGTVDIYMPDAKFFDPELSARYMDAPDYPDRLRSALLEMHRQMGDLVIGDRGVATRGLLVRHLVMPGAFEDSKRILRWIARQVSPRTAVNVMAQYRPMHRAREYPEISRPLDDQQYREVVAFARELGLRLL